MRIYRTVALFLSIAALCLAQGGCSSVPIQNADFAIATANSTSLESIERAIIQSGASLGWEIQPIGPGEAKATLHLRTHTAVVLIRYDLSRVRIDYEDSTNLDHHGDTIHRNYNNWIKNLRTTIQRRISEIPTT